MGATASSVRPFLDFQNNTVLKGNVFGATAHFMFVITALSVKLVNKDISVLQILFLRAVMGLAFMAGPLIIKRINVFEAKNMGLHLLRALIGLGAVSCMFYAVSRITLMEYTTLGKLYPVLVTVFGVILLKEHLKARQGVAVLLGLVGVYIIARPQWSDAWFPLVIMMAGMVLWSIAMVLVRLLTRTNENEVVVFYYMLFSALVLGVAQPFVWKPLDNAQQWLPVIAAGLSGIFMQYCLAQAYRHLPAVKASLWSYTEFFWSFILGFSFWQEVPSLSVWAGMVFIVVSSLLGQGVFALWFPHGRFQHGDKQHHHLASDTHHATGHHAAAAADAASLPPPGE